MLKVEGLVCRYGKVAAVRALSMEVRQGELVSLIGANGAGKTTTLKAISGVLEPAAGRITFLDQDITGATPKRILELGIAHCPEGRRVFPYMSVLENLEMGAYLRSDRAQIAADMERLFERFPILAERRHQAAGTLSGGEQQMLAIARALMLNPRLLLLDEPLEGLAPLIVQELLHALTRIVRDEGLSAIIVEQNPARVLAMTDDAVILERGSVVYAGESARLSSDKVALDRYLAVGGRAH